MTDRVALAPAGSVVEPDGTIRFPNGYVLAVGKLVPRHGGWQRGTGIYVPPPVYKRQRFGEDRLSRYRRATKVLRDLVRERVQMGEGRALYGTALRVWEFFLNASGADMGRAEIVLSQEFIAAELGVSKRSVGRAIGHLKRLRLLDVEQHQRFATGDDGRLVFMVGAPASYRVTVPEQLVEDLGPAVDRVKDTISRNAKARAKEKRRKGKGSAITEPGLPAAELEERAEAFGRFRRIEAAVMNLARNLGSELDEEVLLGHFRQTTVDGQKLTQDELQHVLLPCFHRVQAHLDRFGERDTGPP